MKITHRIPIREVVGQNISMWEVMEIEGENIEEVEEISKEFQSGAGLDQKAWNEALETYLTSNTMHSEDYAEMSKAQQYVIQENKKAFKRIKSKQE